MPTDSRPPQPSLPTRLLLFCLCGGTGLFIILTYAGIVPWKPSGRCRAIFCDPYHWQVLCFGITFFCAGSAFVLPRRWHRVGQLNGLCLLIALLAGLTGSFLFR
ncbi:hypothetical protein [Parachitinimonas caeni]|nr:hypothetical protein [Parachitinimonas caeni]